MLDDVHELGSEEARRQLELRVMRARPELRFVLATRHDLRPGLHRLPALPAIRAQAPLEPLSESEIRVLRYLPTNLSAPEIANELYVSPNTVKTHMSHLYAKLGAHRRAEAVERARALGLLARSARQR